MSQASSLQERLLDRKASEPLKNISSCSKTSSLQDKADSNPHSTVNQSKSEKINFSELLKEYRDRTEFSLPYTIMQAEDVMFVDSKRAVTLEYIFYQREGRYN